MDKLKSRKFWVMVASFLASVGTSIVGLQTDNGVIASVGIICSMLSAAIYAGAEAYVDAAAASSKEEQ